MLSKSSGSDGTRPTTEIEQGYLDPHTADNRSDTWEPSKWKSSMRTIQNTFKLGHSQKPRFKKVAPSHLKLTKKNLEEFLNPEDYQADHNAFVQVRKQPRKLSVPEWIGMLP